VVYSQKGLQTHARQALERAAALQPQNAHYRCNLGAVVERAGDTAGAAVAYRDLLQISPEHAQPRARLQAIGVQGHGPPRGLHNARGSGLRTNGVYHSDEGAAHGRRFWRYLRFYDDAAGVARQGVLRMAGTPAGVVRFAASM